MISIVRKVYKACWERRKRRIPTRFAKGFFLKVLKTWDSVVKSELFAQQQNCKVVR